MDASEAADLMAYPMIKLKLDGDGAWPDLREYGEPGHSGVVFHAQSAEMATLEHGMESGAPSITMRFDLPGGNVVLWETSLKLMLTTLDAVVARHGDPR